RGDPRQPAALLLLRAVPEQRPHDVHLRVAGGRVAAGAVDLLEHGARRADAEPAAAVLLGDQRREPAARRERRDELVRVRFGFERDSRSSRISLSAQSVSPSNTGAGSRTSSQPRFATAFSLVSATDRPVISASVKVESTSRCPKRVLSAKGVLKWTWFVLCVM